MFNYDGLTFKQYPFNLGSSPSITIFSTGTASIAYNSITADSHIAASACNAKLAHRHTSTTAKHASPNSADQSISPKPTLPPLPTSMPTIPNVALPPLPASSLPTMPSIPTIPTTMPSFPFLSHLPQTSSSHEIPIQK
ncbi:UNVERIFIED_CONTAM: hypothetical protein Sangu_1185900 [Sesamum angustifolium]|uniref:Uncharacterized protein n=1 Tax=Sesamum angustifolium TaxID=2727405 RepID=A0AAW2NJK2_9LAMI